MNVSVRDDLPGVAVVIGIVRSEGHGIGINRHMANEVPHCSIVIDLIRVI